MELWLNLLCYLLRDEMYKAHCNEIGPLWQGKPDFLFQIAVKEQCAFFGCPITRTAGEIQNRKICRILGFYLRLTMRVEALTSIRRNLTLEQSGCLITLQRLHYSDLIFNQLTHLRITELLLSYPDKWEKTMHQGFNVTENNYQLLSPWLVIMRHVKTVLTSEVIKAFVAMILFI